MTPARYKKILPLLCLAAIAGLTGCGGGSPPPPPQVFTPLNYDYLPPIVLNISNITIQNDYVPDPGAGTLIGEDPDPPANALTRMLQHRLVANGTPGNGTVTIEDAAIEPVGNTYVGTMSIRLDVASADGLKTGFTEASVSVTQPAPDSDADPNQVQSVLYGITKQLMDAMNVQLQYQIQRNMGSWISYTSNAATPALNSGAPSNGGIQATPLDAPGSPAAGSPGVGSPGAGSPAATPLPVAPQTGTPPQGEYVPLPTQPNGLPLSSQSLGTLPVSQ